MEVQRVSPMIFIFTMKRVKIEVFRHRRHHHPRCHVDASCKKHHYGHQRTLKPTETFIVNKDRFLNHSELLSPELVLLLLRLRITPFDYGCWLSSYSIDHLAVFRRSE